MKKRPLGKAEIPTNPSISRLVDIPLGKAEEVATYLRYEVLQLMTPEDNAQSTAFANLIVGVLQEKKLKIMELFISIGRNSIAQQRILAYVSHIISPPVTSGEHAIKFETVPPPIRSLDDPKPKSYHSDDMDIDDAIDPKEI